MTRITQKKKDYPLSMRLPESDVAIIDRAADIRGRSRTDFVREAAVRAAEEVLLESNVIRMSPEAFAEFLEILNRPGKAPPAMVATLKRKAPWEADER